MKSVTIQSKPLFMALVLAFSSTTVTASPSRGAASADSASSETAEELTEIFDAYPQVRKDETLAELYYRVETRLSDADKSYVAKIFDGHARDKAPTAKFKGNQIIFSYLQKELKLEFLVKKDSFSILANGKTLPKTALDDSSTRYRFLEKVLTEKTQEKKQTSAWLFDLLMPQAHADWSQYLPLIGTGVMMVGAFLLMKRQQRAQAKANANPVCTAPSPACCAVGTGYVVHTNGCCQQIGGLGAGSPTTCPLGNAASPYYTPSPVGSGSR